MSPTLTKARSAARASASVIAGYVPWSSGMKAFATSLNHKSTIVTAASAWSGKPWKVLGPWMMRPAQIAAATTEKGTHSQRTLSNTKTRMNDAKQADKTHCWERSRAGRPLAPTRRALANGVSCRCDVSQRQGRREWATGRTCRATR